MVYNEEEAHEFANSVNMMIYYLFMFKKGPTWHPNSTPEVQKLQEEHIANLTRLGAMGKLILNGPLLDSFATGGDIRGVGVLKAGSLEEALELINTDPMVKAKRLIVEVHPWMVDKNILP